jgi:DNA-binding transcriptional regulator YiaG
MRLRHPSIQKWYEALLGMTVTERDMGVALFMSLRHNGRMFTQLLRQRRTEQGLNQTELAALLGVEQTTISGWESGRRRPDDLEHIKLIEKHLGIPRHKIRPDRYEPFQAIA